MKERVGYWEYLKKPLPNPKQYFIENTKFIYKDLQDEVQQAAFAVEGFKKPYPKATLGVKFEIPIKEK